MLILRTHLFGMLIGAGAGLILGVSAKGIDWTLALVAGLIGSFVHTPVGRLGVKGSPLLALSAAIAMILPSLMILRCP